MRGQARSRDVFSCVLEKFGPPSAVPFAVPPVYRNSSLWGPVAATDRLFQHWYHPGPFSDRFVRDSRETSGTRIVAAHRSEEARAVWPGRNWKSRAQFGWEIRDGNRSPPSECRTSVRGNQSRVGKEGKKESGWAACARGRGSAAEAQERSFGFRIPFGRPVEWAPAFVRERPDAEREREGRGWKGRKKEAIEREREGERRRKGPPAPHNAA